MEVKIIGLILSVIAIHEITGRPLPAYIKSCKRNDPNISDCLKKMVENLRPFISKGIPEMRILPLDPLTVPSATLNQGSGSMNFIALFTDLKGYGAKNFQIQRMKIDIKNQSMEIDLKMPLFRIDSKYNINGTILVLPINGNGKFVGNFTNIQAKVKFGLKLVEKKNKKTHLEINNNKVDLTFGTLKLNFGNLFNGNKELGDQTNQYINSNWRDLMEEINPLVEGIVSSIVMGIFSPVLNAYSLDELFPV